MLVFVCMYRDVNRHANVFYLHAQSGVLSMPQAGLSMTAVALDKNLDTVLEGTSNLEGDHIVPESHLKRTESCVRGWMRACMRTCMRARERDTFPASHIST